MKLEQWDTGEQFRACMASLLSNACLNLLIVLFWWSHRPLVDRGELHTVTINTNNILTVCSFCDVKQMKQIRFISKYSFYFIPFFVIHDISIDVYPS